MGELLRDVVSFATGTATGFSFSVWLFITLLVGGVGSVVLIALPRMFEPIAIELALRPGRILAWLPISIIGVPLLLALLMATIVGAPFSVVAAFAIAIGTVIGYVSLAYVTGDRMARAAGRELPPYAAFILGLACLRIVRLIPFVGGTLHSILVWIAMAGACAVGWDMIYSWHKRRLPDDVQFRNEQLTEWNPPADEQ